MGKIQTYDANFRSRYASDESPLKVKIEEVAAANLAYSITRFSTEIDPPTVRRAFQHVGIDVSGWNINDASQQLYIPAQRGVRLIPVNTAPYYAWGVYNEADTGGGTAIAHITPSDLQTALNTDPNGTHAASARRVLNLSQPIVIPFQGYRPFQITVFVQGHTQSASVVGLVMVCAGITPADPNARWFALPTHNNNTIMFGAARIPSGITLNGFVGGNASDNMVVGCMQVFPFPSVVPANYDGTSATSNWNYYIFPGFLNRTASLLRHAYMCVTVEAEVL